MPQVLWSLYLNLPASDIKLNESAPSNIHLCSGPDLDLDFDFAVNQVNYLLITHQSTIIFKNVLILTCFDGI